MSKKYPEGALLKVKLEVRLPKAATCEEVDAWLAFSFRANDTISSSNPLIDSEPEPFGSSFDWDYNGYVGREEKFDIQQTKNGRAYKVRRIREKVTP